MGLVQFSNLGPRWEGNGEGIESVRWKYDAILDVLPTSHFHRS